VWEVEWFSSLPEERVYFPAYNHILTAALAALIDTQTYAQGLTQFTGGIFMELHLHDKVELKKAHPCGCVQWEILRVGMDIKLKCLGCGHELMLPRNKAEKSIRKILGTD
jgi:hypothetical protein